MTPEQMLDRLGQLGREINGLQEAFETELAELMGNYSALADKKSQRDALDLELKALMKKEKKKIFGDRDRVKLPSGVLIRTVTERVRLPRKTLEICEGLGWDEVIKTVKSLDRKKVEAFPDDRLAILGAKKKPVETFGYDLKGIKHGGKRN